MPSTILTTPTDLFTTPAAPVASLLPSQVNPALPQAATVSAATGMLLPAADLARIMAHFPEEVYDLRPTSHLSRFVAALVGDAGAGQLRRRQLLARIMSTLDGASWLDQDRFWGAVFSLRRTLDEQLSIDPADQVATVSEWDALARSDAAYRERIIALAATLPLAGTLPGLAAAASAIISAPVEVSETWALLDVGAPTPGRTWGQVAALGDWGVLDTQRWFKIENVYAIGLSGVNSRAEVVLRPHKTYAAGRAGQIDAASDAKALTEVLSKLIPDGILITVDNAVAAPGIPVQIASAWADSAHVQIHGQVTVSPALSAATVASCYPRSTQQITDAVDPGATRYLPTPADVTTGAAAWDFNAAITAVTSYSFDAGGVDLTVPGTGTPVAGDDQVLSWRDGSTTTFTPDLAVAPPTLAAAARLGAAGHLSAHPWSGSRKVVPVHA